MKFLKFDPCVSLVESILQLRRPLTRQDLVFRSEKTPNSGVFRRILTFLRKTTQLGESTSLRRAVSVRLALLHLGTKQAVKIKTGVRVCTKQSLERGPAD